MANGKDHRVGSIVAAVGTSLVRTVDQPLPHRVLEAVGAGLVGPYFGMLPDVLEPAHHSFHRDIAHSVSTAGAILTAARHKMGLWEAFWRRHADNFAAQRANTTGAEWAILLIAEMVCRMLAGAAAGLAAGYLSHLVLDALTPRSIPLLSRHLV